MAWPAGIALNLAAKLPDVDVQVVLVVLGGFVREMMGDKLIHSI